MDDSSFEQWSATLLELRQARYEAIKLLIDERGKEYSVKDLFDHLMVSLDQILSQWWDYERGSWEKTPPADIAFAGETLKSELESVSDFEIEASNKEIEMARDTAGLDEEDIEKGRQDLQAFMVDLKKNYLMKIDSLLNSLKKAPPPPPTTAPTYAAPRGSARGRSGGGGIGMFIMFLVGLSLGTGLAFFFRESGKKSVQQIAEDKEKLAGEKLEIMSEYTALQETYFMLAKGKLMTIPELDRIMKPIKEDAASKRRQVDVEFARTREGLIKKIPAGDRLDRALDKLEEDKNARMEEINNRMNARLDPYLKQQQIHEEIMQKQ